jgi:SAM-dependent methyltransferase
MCKSEDLYEFLDLGHTPPADDFRKKEDLERDVSYFPLKVVQCEHCGLSQLSHVVDPKLLFQNDYPYESSTTETGRIHWMNFASNVIDKLSLAEDSLIVDIGSNVGVLLSSFNELGMRVQGIDPAPNIVEIANQRGVDTICAFISEDAANQVVTQKGKASVVTGTNVFAHVDDLAEFVNAVKRMLTDDGVFVFEAPYFVNLLNHNEYDTIYHEHLSYISIKPLIPFFDQFGMEVFDIEESSIHGGSIRVYVGQKNSHTIADIVGALVEKEEQQKIYSKDRLDAFAEQVANNRKELVWMLQKLLHEGKKVVAVSAPAKGMTLLNYCRIGNDMLDFVTEKSALKLGRYTPGTHIPVVSDDELLTHQPDYALVLAWNFATEIIENLSEYQSRGGKFIIPIPMPKIIG